MSVRSRIVVEFNNKDFVNQLSNYKDISTYFGVKDNYCLVYCNRNDEKNVLEMLNSNGNVAYLSNEYIDGYNF